MPSLTDTQTNSLSSTEVSIGYIENYTEDSGTTATQLEDLNTQESADLQLSPSDIWLAAPSELDLAPDDNLLSVSTSGDVLYEPSAELIAQGVTYDSSPTLSVLAASGSQSDLNLNTWDQNSTLPSGQLDYSLNTDGGLDPTSPTLSTSSGSTSFSSGSNSSLYLATTDSTAIGTPFSLTGSGSPSDSSTTTSSTSENNSSTPSDSGGSPTPPADSGSTPTNSTDSSSTALTSTDTDTPFTSDSTADTTSIDTGSGLSSSLSRTSSTSGSDPVPVPFEMHSSIGLLIISLIIARKISTRQKAKKLIGVCCPNP